MNDRPKRPFLVYALPTLLLLAAVVFPLVRGSDTLYLRDVMATHLPLKAAEAAALRGGRLPLVDPYRGQGQALLGNLNAAPLYPDNLLYLVASPLWALNAHFWIHLLLAVPAMYALGRAWELGRRASWVAAVTWGTSGFFLSQLNLYNLVAGVALTPALAAAALRLDGPRRWPAAAAAGALWGLLLLAGDPITAALALGLATAARLARSWRAAESRRRWWTGWLALGLALGCGTLLAAPQLIELRRILEGSFRSLYGYSRQAATAASWDPRQSVGWLLPFPFGRPDLATEGSFWGHRFHAGSPPLYFSLYAGLLPLALAAAAAFAAGRRRLALWSWGVAALGLFFALGRFNPLAGWLFALPGLRYPSKLWLAVAVGAALLAGVGFESVFLRRRPAAGRAFWTTLAALGLLLAAGWGALALFPDGSEALLRRLIPADRPAAFVAAERLRLAGSCRASLALAAALALVSAACRRRPVGWGGALLALHAAGQLWLLAPLYATDAALPYRVPPPALAAVPSRAVVVHGEAGGLFGGESLHRARFPDGSSRWLARRAYHELYPFTGPLLGRRYALNASPEGLDAFTTVVARAAVADASDAVRLRLLRAFGVDRLLLSRPLAADAEAHAELLARLPGPGAPLHVYALDGALPEAAVVGRVHAVADLEDAYQRLVRPGFDPRREAVAMGLGRDHDGPPGRVRLRSADAERLLAEVTSPRGGLLIVRRAHLALWRAELDGEPAAVMVANFQLLGVEVPAGEHRVELWVDRRPLAWGLALSLLGALGLAAIALVSRLRPPPSPPGSPATLTAR